MRDEGSIYRLRVEEWMIKIEGEMRDDGGLRCPTGKHNPCASLEAMWR